MHVAVDGEGVDMNMSEVFWVIFPTVSGCLLNLICC